jgi:hypothetical protein
MIRVRFGINLIPIGNEERTARRRTGTVIRCGSNSVVNGPAGQTAANAISPGMAIAGSSSTVTSHSAGGRVFT